MEESAIAKLILEEIICRTQRELDGMKILLAEISWKNLTAEDAEPLRALFIKLRGL